MGGIGYIAPSQAGIAHNDSMMIFTCSKRHDATTSSGCIFIIRLRLSTRIADLAGCDAVARGKRISHGA